ncbi:PREDICTED: uncharacterized protein LOC109582566 [Amphimedon queenslandica]|uniref:Death domain-containing protein n=1 Tax=Amphimedon queenslandica TaxID=400682 RepID=A0AAN0J777_AMPQE|nr:PREDICTED: uncharacterized protein LOC109582566 [Amphimedon queenslandica]|eukprot:XP_019852870.1 PREDICTED: uncharacterized protein LOC109582566 [Amphimedon queenslandica]
MLCILDSKDPTGQQGDYYLLTYCKAKHLKKWHFALTVSATCIIIALVGVAINHFIVEKKDNSTTITSQVPTTISSAPPEPTITQTNPNELNVGDVKKVLKALKKAMFGPANWRDLGLSLGLIVTTLDTIGKTNGDANDYLEKTIQKWLKKEDQVKETTWQILKEAVKSTGDKAAAERIPLH